MDKYIMFIPRIFDKTLLFFKRLAEEQPFRIFFRALIKTFSTSVRMKARWDAVARPHYLVGILAAADQARREGVSEICVIEFGVAGGNGLLALEEYAAAVEKETGVKIAVYGFDTGTGIPEMCGDYRDHPDQWQAMDYPMDEQLLRQRLDQCTTLIIGNVAQTVPKFVRHTQRVPVGFIAIDVDLYSSTHDALQIFVVPGKQMLRRVAIYFDDIDFFFNHRFAGELLAIDEFNTKNHAVKIDQWRGIANGRVFPEQPWIKKMYIAHDIHAISQVTLKRPSSADLRLV